MNYEENSPKKKQPCRDEKEFWMIWNPERAEQPSVQHPLREKAVKEAERLARLYPGQTFFLLHAEAKVTVDNVTWQSLDQEQPF